MILYSEKLLLVYNQHDWAISDKQNIFVVLKMFIVKIYCKLNIYKLKLETIELFIVYVILGSSK